ncbi:ribose 5-phosphate isomerase B [Sphingomonas daechungensis]|uniref:Ribose 5-phosphate isomerase B n=1 Tax=Sphingomonas daechungensis TaxID=1176646 RepID=A0ABX6SXW2_9SPHN|nr:ribose 5-phosphate isomerase B [Sphingomonas daechungensis]QNP42427.1 ribose 5-phosphate isomerase B [Sphingomonas daechungensis]
MRIVMTADHAGFEMKDQLADWLRADGHEVLDFGTNSAESVDYPRYGALLADALADGRAERGITVCGSGIGVAIAANRNPACRCAQVSEPLSASLARKHNDCNAIALGARLIGLEMAKACVTAFLTSEFLGGRHQRRVDQLANPSEQEPA